MKILKIYIKNIASIPEATVDFTKQPLLAAPLFLICGDTGAGKSTITDAVCLAFYGETPRLKDLQGDDFDGEDGIKTTDVRNFIRKGTTESIASVDFLADDSCVYRAEWASARKKNGKIGDISRALYRIKGGVAENLDVAKREFNAMIVQLTGLDFNRFVRSVLLAQNQFSKFLFARRDEKSEILQMLTDTGIYEAISKKIFEKFSAVKNELAVLTKGIENHEIVTTEMLSGANDVLEKIIVESSAADHKLGELTKKLEAEKKIAELRETVTQRRAELVEVQNDFCRALSLLDELRRKIDDNGTELDRCQKEYDEAASGKDVYDNIQTIDSQIDALVSSINAIDGLRTKSQDASSSIVNLNTRLGQVLGQCSAAEQALRAAENTLKTNDDALKAFDYDALAVQRDNVTKLESWLPHIQNIIADIERKSKDLASMRAQSQQLAKSSADDNEQIAKQEAELTKLETEYKAQNEIYQQQMLAVTNNLKKLRLQLVDGSPCPLCGSTRHPYSSQSSASLDAAFNTAKQMVEDKKKQTDALRESLAKRRGVVNEKQSQLKRIVEVDIPKLEREIDESRQRKLKARDFFGKELSADFSDIDDVSFVSKITELIAARKRQNEIQDAKYQQLKKLFDVSRADYDSKNRTLSTLKDSKSKSENELAVKKTELSNIDANIAANESHRKQLAEALKSRFPEIDDNVNTAQLAALKERNDKAARQFVALGKQLEALKKEGDELRAVLEGCDAAVHLKKMFADAAPMPNSATATPRQLPNIFASLLEKAKMLSAQIGELNSKLTETKSAGTPESVETLAAALAECKKESDALKAQVGGERQRIEQLKAKKTEYDRLVAERDKRQKDYDNWNSLNNILGSSDGKRLRNYAQVHTLRALLQNADRRLSGLTNKYRLRCGGDSLAILVDDLEMGVRRPVSTLSGGESFMVSLALALGLSDMMQGGRGSEMLFIDEGFGTLDQQSLDSVLSVLQKLHSQGRKVGIISHVPELEERIDAKIRVVKCSGDNTSSEVIVHGNFI